MDPYLEYGFRAHVALWIHELIVIVLAIRPSLQFHEFLGWSQDFGACGAVEAFRVPEFSECFELDHILESRD